MKFLLQSRTDLYSRYLYIFNVRGAALGVEAEHVTPLHDLCDVRPEVVSGLVAWSAGQDEAAGLLPHYLLDGLHQGHSFT